MHLPFSMTRFLLKPNKKYIKIFPNIRSSVRFFKDVCLWEDDDDYKASRNIVRSMKVVNDIAERGGALIEEYNKLITTDEEQKQFLLLVVKNFRQK